MKKALSLVLTITILGTIFFAVLNSGAVYATSNDLTVTLGTIDASPNEYISIPLNFTNVPSNGIETFNMTIFYNPNYLEYLDYEPGNIIGNPDLNFYINKQTDGILKLLFLDFTMENFNIKSDGLAANLKFKVLNTSNNSTYIDIYNQSFGGHYQIPIYSKLISGKVNISGSSATTPIPESNFSVKNRLAKYKYRR